MTQILFYQHCSSLKHVFQKSVEELGEYHSAGQVGGRHQVVVVVCVALILTAHPVDHRKAGRQHNKECRRAGTQGI